MTKIIRCVLFLAFISLAESQFLYKPSQQRLTFDQQLQRIQRKSQTIPVFNGEINLQPPLPPQNRQLNHVSAFQQNPPQTSNQLPQPPTQPLPIAGRQPQIQQSLFNQPYSAQYYNAYTYPPATTQIPYLPVPPVPLTYLPIPQIPVPITQPAVCFAKSDATAITCGAPLSRNTVASTDDCLALCDHRADCATVVFRQGTAVCELYGQIVRLIRQRQRKRTTFQKRRRSKRHTSIYEHDKQTKRARYFPSNLWRKNPSDGGYYVQNTFPGGRQYNEHFVQTQRALVQRRRDRLQALIEQEAALRERRRLDGESNPRVKLADLATATTELQKLTNDEKMLQNFLHENEQNKPADPFQTARLKQRRINKLIQQIQTILNEKRISNSQPVSTKPAVDLNPDRINRHPPGIQPSGFVIEPNTCAGPQIATDTGATMYTKISCQGQVARNRRRKVQKIRKLL